MFVQRNIEERSYSHSCSGKAMIVTNLMTSHFTSPYRNGRHSHVKRSVCFFRRVHKIAKKATISFVISVRPSVRLSA